jgi:hypothetical protein
MESTDDDRRPIPAHHRIDVHRCPVTRRSVASSDFRNSQNNVPASALIKTRLQPDDHMFIEIATRSIDLPQPGGRKRDNNSICLFSYRHLQQSIQSAGSSSLQVHNSPDSHRPTNDADKYNFIRPGSCCLGQHQNLKPVTGSLQMTCFSVTSEILRRAMS